MQPADKLKKLEEFGLTGRRNTYDYAANSELLDLVLNKKKDIKFIPSAEDEQSAARYGKSHGLRLQTEDINNDGINDIILYNKDGQPVIINGYRLVPSRFPLRQDYKENYPTKAARKYIGGFPGYMKQHVWHAGDFDDEGNREVEFDAINLPPQIEFYKSLGYKVPPAPSKSLSIYQKIIRVLRLRFQCFLKFQKSSQFFLSFSILVSIRIETKIVSIILIYQLILF